MLTRRATAFLAAALVIGLAAALYRHYYPLPPKLTLRAARFAELDGWDDDRVAAALPAFLKSCAIITAHADGEPFDPVPKSSDFGTVGEWRPLCAEAATLSNSDATTRTFFETNFIPVLAGNNGNPDGLFTGYFEIVLNGSRRHEGPYQTPIYRPPPDPKAYSRAQIEDGALAGKGLELLWVDDPIGAYFLQIQGSGVVHLTDGKTVRLGYDGGNGHPFVSIGRLLVERSEVPLKDMTMQTLRDWVASHGAAGKALMREDPSFVFFKEISGDGPYGSEKVVLTARRSLAVDRRFIPLGMPLWLDATERFTTGAIRQLVIAQDTGGAIKGPVRGDLYWGGGDAAGKEAGAMNALGHYLLLLPNAVAARALAAGHD
jgi:peptidoglycan lytic transglycosylase A